MNTLVKKNWEEVKHTIKKSNKVFFELIENIAPNNKLSIYLAEYSYGEQIGKKNIVYIPDNKGGTHVLGDRDTPNDVLQDLDYGKNSFPLGIIIENHCEWYYQDEVSHDNYPFAIQGEGTIFNQQIIFKEDITIENNIISVCAGAKSIFMLPYIGCQTNHDRLVNRFNLSIPAPKRHQDHSNLFRMLLSSDNIVHDWTSKILFFSQEWIGEIRTNKNWLPVKHYFSENLRKKLASNIYNSFYNDLFSMTEKINYFRPTPYLIDTSKYIFSIAMGQGIGYQPAINNKLLPLEKIQNIYQNIYQVSYTPTIMVPGILNNENNSMYYSLQLPSTKINTFKKGLNNSTYRELIALKNILFSYKSDFASSKSKCYKNDLYWACINTKFEFYHNKALNNKDGISHSVKIEHDDFRFKHSYMGKSNFSANAKFFRGCIKISR
jgi:hypothetical protein